MQSGILSVLQCCRREEVGGWRSGRGIANTHIFFCAEKKESFVSVVLNQWSLRGFQVVSQINDGELETNTLYTV